MRHTILFVCCLLSSTAALCQGKPAPNEIDLKANYCVAVVQDSVEALEAMQPDPKSPPTSDADKKLAQAMAAGLEHAQADLRNLRVYLAPRLKVVQLDHMAEQKLRAERDIANAKEAKAKCMEQCPADSGESNKGAQQSRSACLGACYSKISIADDLKTCRPTHWLPR